MISGVYNVDCLTYMKALPDKYFDLALIDAPYRDEEDNAPQYEMRRAGMRSFGGKPTDEYFREFERIGKNQIIWGANNYGYPFKGFVAWDKGIRGADRYSQVEIASLSDGLSTVSKYVQINAAGRDKFHPTAKPVELYAWLLRNYAKEGDKIFDPYMGSQSSRIAAYKLGFFYIGCELNPDFFKKGCEWFDRECKGVHTLHDGRKVVEQNLFEL